MKLPLSSIVLEDRRREDYGDIENLAKSLVDNGQISPILVAPREGGTWRLVAGGRRVQAAKTLGWTEIEALDTVRIDGRSIAVADLTERQLRILELEENTRRKDYNWKEHCRSVAQLHYLQQLEHGFKTEGGQGKGWSTLHMADLLGFSSYKTRYILSIAEELKDEKSTIHQCTGIKEAIDWVIAKREREADAEINRRRALAASAGVPIPSPRSEAPQTESEAPVDTSHWGSVETPSVPRTKVYIRGIRKSFLDSVPDEDFMAESAMCVLGYKAHVLDYQLAKLLHPEGFAVVWDIQPWTLEASVVDAGVLLRWNQIKCDESFDLPFRPNFVDGWLLQRSDKPARRYDHPSSATISCMPEDPFDILPLPVVDYSISPLTLANMAVFCLEGVNPLHIAELGRVPIFFEPDPRAFHLKVEGLRAHYESTIPNVEVIVP